MEPFVKLYYIPAACSLAPHIVLRELDLTFDLIKVDHQSRQTADGQHYNDLNPLGYVPLLQLDDGSLLREGPAIVQYLADLKPGVELASDNGTIARYRLQEWLNFLASEIHKGFIPLLYARLAGTYGTATAKPKLEARFAWLNDTLAKRQYLMGDTFTVADACLYSLMQWGQATWLEDLSRRHPLRRAGASWIMVWTGQSTSRRASGARCRGTALSSG